MNLSNLIELDNLIKKRDQFKRIFFYRICGTGMGSAAALMREMGYHVEGGDTEFYPPMSHYLRDINIPCHKLSEMKKEDYLQYDLIIVGNVVSGKSENARFIEELGVPFTSFPVALGAFVLKDRNVVGIAGTHGKTTTTYLMLQIFEKLGFDPGHLVGGVIEGIPSSRLGKDDLFFIESDEYDSAYFHKRSKFHYYCIDQLILTSLEFDHGDIFDSLAAIEKEFRDLLSKISDTAIICADFSSSHQLYEECERKRSQFKQLIEYGQKSTNGPFAIRSRPEGSEFDLLIGNKKESFSTNLVGIHNVLNVSTCILLAHSMGVKLELIKNAVTDLKMVKRRQEERGYYQQALVIDDFAHHPTAVRVTLDGLAKKYPDKELIVFFAPSSATARSSIFQQEFTESLQLAKEVVIVPSRVKTTVKNGENLDVAKMAAELNAHHIPTSEAEDLTKLLDKMNQIIKKRGGENCVLVILSNGSILGLWESHFVKELKPLH